MSYFRFLSLPDGCSIWHAFRIGRIPGAESVSPSRTIIHKTKEQQLFAVISSLDISPELYTWLVIPLLIFLSRVIDVSLQTLRVIFVSRNMRMAAPIIGFFEVMIWLVAIQQIMSNLSNVMCFLAYGAGFSAGTYVGIWLERKLSIGTVVVRVITPRPVETLIARLRSSRFGVTRSDGEGASGKVNILFTVIRRQDLNKVVSTVRETNPGAFYSIEDIRSVGETGVYPVRTAGCFPSPLGSLALRKGK